MVFNLSHHAVGNKQSIYCLILLFLTAKTALKILQKSSLCHLTICTHDIKRVVPVNICTTPYGRENLEACIHSQLSGGMQLFEMQKSKGNNKN